MKIECTVEEFKELIKDEEYVEERAYIDGNLIEIERKPSIKS